MSDIEEFKLERNLRIKLFGAPEYVYRGFQYCDDTRKHKNFSCTPVTPQKSIVYLDKSIQASSVKLEEGREHIVQCGETLSGIAKRYQIKLDDLRQDNPRIKDPDKIYAGEVLKIVAPAVPTQILVREEGSPKAKQIPYDQLKLETCKTLHLITPHEQPMVLKCDNHDLSLNALGTGPYNLKRPSESDPTRIFLTKDWKSRVPFIKGNPSFQSLQETPAEEEVFTVPFDKDGSDDEFINELIADQWAADFNADKQWFRAYHRELRKGGANWLKHFAIGEVIEIGTELKSITIKTNSDGQRYLIFRGNSGLRRIFQGTRYRLGNAPKFAIYGVWRSIRSTTLGSLKAGLKVSMLWEVSITVVGKAIDYFSSPKDQRDLSDSIIEAITAIVKGVVATLTSFLIVKALIAAGLLTGGVGLFIAFSAIIIFAETTLNDHDKKNDITQGFQDQFNNWQNYKKR